MAFATTYAGLIADILMWTDEDANDELREMVDTMIALAETRTQRDLDLECFQGEVAGGSLVIGTREKARPATLIKAASIWLTIGTTRTLMLPKTYDYCMLFAPVVATTAPPQFVAEKDDANLYFVPTPDVAYVMTTYGIVRCTQLSDANPTNWLANNVGDLLLKCALIESEQYLIATAPVAKWKLDYKELLMAAKKEYGALSRAEYLMAGGQ